MDLESGGTIYIEAVIGRRVRLTTFKSSEGGEGIANRLTTEEARTLATALLAAVVEAEAYGVCAAKGCTEDRTADENYCQRHALADAF